MNLSSMMRQHLLRSPLMQAAGIYGAGNLLRQLLPVLLIPVLTRHLTPTDYGTVAMFGVVVNVMLPVVGLNAHGAINRKYFDRSEIDYPAYVFNALLLVGGATAAVAVLLASSGELIARVTELPPPWLWIALVVAAGQSVTLALLALQQAAARPVAYAIVQVTQAVLVSLVTLWLVVGAAQDWRGPVRAQLLGALIFALVSLVLFVRGGWIRMTIDREHVRHVLQFGLPLIPHVLAAVAIQAIDRLIITHYAGLAQTGVYTLGYQLGMVIGLLEDSFNRAWLPWLFQRLQTADESVKRRIVLFTYGYFVAITLCAVALGALAPWLLSLVAPARFGGASAYVIWIALGYAFSGMYKMVSGYIFYAERTGVLAWMTILAAVLNAVTSYLLVPRYGAAGAAYAATVGFAASFLLTWLAAARVYPMPWLGALRGLWGKGGAPVK